MSESKRPGLPRASREQETDLDNALSAVFDTTDSEGNLSEISVLDPVGKLPEDSGVVANSAIPQEDSTNLKNIGKPGTYFYIRDPKDGKLRKVGDD